MKKKPLICIIGRTASGKDTMANYLAKEKELKAVVSYTNRPIRDNENDGEEHYFVSDDEMKEILETKDIAAYTKIEDPNSGTKGYEYCATMEEVKNSDVYLIDPIGFKKLEEELHGNDDSNNDIVLFAVYCYASYNTRYRRLINSGRGEAALKAFEDRNANEDAQFTEFEENFPNINSSSVGNDFYYWIDNEERETEFIDKIRLVLMQIKSVTREMERK